MAEDISKLLGALRLSDIVLSVPHTTLRGTDRADTAPPNETTHAVDKHRLAGCLWLIRWSVDMETTLSSPHGVSFGRLAPGLGVQDISRSLQFYCGVLGFNKVFENGNPVGFVILKKDKAELHLSQNKNHKASLNNVAHLMVEDATVLYEHCTTHNVRIIKALRDADFGLRCFVLADPDGNRIDIGEVLPNPAGAV